MHIFKSYGILFHGNIICVILLICKVCECIYIACFEAFRIIKATCKTEIIIINILKLNII